MQRIISFLTAITVTVACAMAQSPIKWRTSLKMTGNAEGTIMMKAIVTDGWHLYGTNLPKGGPKSTTFDFAQSSDIEFIGAPVPSEKPIEIYDKMFDLKLNWWAANVTFTQRFKVTGNSPAIKGTITYMGCNDETCMPPRKEKIS